jgi:hypothetical protein
VAQAVDMPSSNCSNALNNESQLKRIHSWKMLTIHSATRFNGSSKLQPSSNMKSEELVYQCCTIPNFNFMIRPEALTVSSSGSGGSSSSSSSSSSIAALVVVVVAVVAAA